MAHPFRGQAEALVDDLFAGSGEPATFTPSGGSAIPVIAVKAAHDHAVGLGDLTSARALQTARVIELRTADVAARPQKGDVIRLDGRDAKVLETAKHKDSFGLVWILRVSKFAEPLAELHAALAVVLDPIIAAGAFAEAGGRVLAPLDAIACAVSATVPLAAAADLVFSAGVATSAAVSSTAQAATSAGISSLAGSARADVASQAAGAQAASLASAAFAALNATAAGQTALASAVTAAASLAALLASTLAPVAGTAAAGAEPNLALAAQPLTVSAGAAATVPVATSVSTTLAAVFSGAASVPVTADAGGLVLDPVVLTANITGFIPLDASAALALGSEVLAAAATAALAASAAPDIVETLAAAAGLAVAASAAGGLDQVAASSAANNNPGGALAAALDPETAASAAAAALAAQGAASPTQSLAAQAQGQILAAGADATAQSLAAAANANPGGALASSIDAVAGSTSANNNPGGVLAKTLDAIAAAVTSLGNLAASAAGSLAQLLSSASSSAIAAALAITGGNTALAGTSTNAVSASAAATLAAIGLSITATVSVSGVAIDTTVADYIEGTGGFTRNTSITVGSNSNRMVLAYFGVNAPNATQAIPSSVQFNGSNMTLLGSIDNPTADQRLFVYYTLAPATGAHNVSITMPSSTFSTAVNIAVYSLYNVNQTTPTLSAAGMSIEAAGTLWAGDACTTSGLGIFAIYAWGNPTITGWNGIPKYVSSGAISTATAQTSRTPAAPAGRIPGDIEIATCASENNATHSSSSTGWNKISQTNSGSGWTVSYWWRIYNGTNVDPVISWTGSADASAQRHAYRDALASGTPVVTLGTVGAGTTSTHTSTGGNTTQANSLALYHDHANANTAIATPSGWTEDFDAGSATGPMRKAGGHKEIATSGGASGNISVTGANAAWVQQQLELKCGAQAVPDAGVNADNGDGSIKLRTYTEPGQAFNAFGADIASGSLYSAQMVFVGVNPA